ncbi:MAG: outer membrane beta-barrel protein [Acidobacteriota bacterium]
MKSLVAILSIVLLCWGVDLSAQEKKDDKKLEITGYFGAGGRGTEGRYGSTFDVPSCGLGVELYLTPHISLEGEINYLPNTAYVHGPAPGGMPGWSDEYRIKDEKYRLLWNINALFYFDIPNIKRNVSIFITAGIGFQYDRVEYTVGSFTTLEQVKYGRGQSWFQFPTFGGGLKLNIKGDWSLRFLYKIHRFAGEGLQTNRFALGLSCRF